MRALLQEKPKVLIVQNPSIVLGYLSLLLRPFFKYKLIMDCHNAALFPLEGKYEWLVTVAQFLIKKADFVIVTNNELANLVRNLSGKPIILNDPIPGFSYEKLDGNSTKQVTLISTWAEDEPVDEFISAASSFSQINFVITGKAKPDIATKAPTNIQFPGFVSRKDYINLIANSDLIVDLTHRENCLVCGAYEAISVEVPLLLSNTTSLKNTFDYGAIFCDNSIDAIKGGLGISMQQLDVLQQDILIMKRIHTERWNGASQVLKDNLCYES
jgi:glycosyltransferase involved in cell wall biosynthesis